MMPSEDLRARNLAAFFSEGDDARALVASHSPTGISVIPSRRGSDTLRVGGQLLHSSVDPEAEAARLVADERLAQAKLVVLFGLGAGHTLRALRARTRAKILAFEPSLDVLSWLLGSCDLLGDAAMRPDAIAVDVHSLRDRLGALHLLGEEIALVAPPSYVRAFPAEASLVASEVGLYAERARISDATWDLRLRLWIDNLIDSLPMRARFGSAASLTGRFRGVPGVVVSAGPSLAKNAHLLDALRGRAVVASTNTAMRALERANVVPDLVVGLEALDVSPQFAGCARLPETFALLDSVASPGLFGLPFGGGFVFDDGNPFYQSWLDARFSGGASWVCGLCVAHAAFVALREMGCDPIILVGQDLAHTGGRVYARGTIFEEMTASAEGGAVVFDHFAAKLDIDGRTSARSPGMSTFKPQEERVLLPGYDGGEVESTVAFRTFARWFEAEAHETGRTRRLLNCTEGGARLDGFEQRPLAEVAAGLHTERDVRGSLRALASRPMASKADVERVARKGAAEHAGIAREVASLRRGLRGAGRTAALGRLRSATSGSVLLNGYVRAAMNELRRASQGGAEPESLERTLVDTVEDAASSIAARMDRAAKAVREAQEPG